MELFEQIKLLVVRVLDELSLELVEMQFKGARGNRLLRVFVDTENGVTIDQCKEASRAISEVLDMEDLISDRYRLEVSSPGVERPLKTERDFEKNKGRRARITYSLEEQKVTITGIIESVEDGSLRLKDGKKEYRVDLSLIEDARIVLQW